MEDDMVGLRFGKLIVDSRVEDYVAPSGGTHKKYACMCDCGKQVNVLKEHLLSGRQKSCGCLKKERRIVTHGKTQTRLYRIWSNMCNRCSNKNNPVWRRYGERGITVCDDWKTFENFRKWAVENNYTDILTIDRIDNNKGYNPSNCRWADNFVQSNNKRNNHMIEYRGEIKTLSEWAKCLNIPYKTLHRRIVGLGWKIERAFNQPVRKSPIYHDLSNKKDG